MQNKPTYKELEQRVKELEQAEKKHQRFEDWFTSSTIKMDVEELSFETLFDVEELQKIQDQFSEATGVASIITRTDGTPITSPSNFCDLCKIIRKTEEGLCNCLRSDATLGKFNPHGPTIKTCLSSRLWDAGVSISISSKHIANWLIGQVRNEEQSEEKIIKYARKIGADEKKFIEAFLQVPVMSKKQFTGIAELLYTLANQLSEAKYRSFLQNKILKEQKEAKDQLIESTERLTQIIIKTPFPISIHAEDGEIIFVNQCCWDKTGYSIDDVPTVKDWIRIAHRDDPERITQVNKESYKLQERSFRGEYLITTKDGKKLVWEYSSAPLGKTPDGRKMIMTVAADITHRKKFEDALAVSEKKYRSYIDNSPVTIFVTDKTGKYIDVNSAGCKMLGYSRDEILSKCIPEIDPDPGNNEKHKGFSELLENKHYRGERKLLCKDGSFIDVDLGAVMLDDNTYMGFCFDITERKRMEELIITNTENVTRLNERFELAADSAGIGVWELDLIDNSLHWDDNMFKLYGVKKSDFNNQYSAWQNTVHPEDIEQAEKEFNYAITNKIDFDSVFRVIRHEDKTVHYMKAFAKLKFDKHGNAIRMTGVNYDLSDQKELEKDLKSALHHAEDANRAKSEFLSTMSHEIRTPLNGILGFSGMLGEEIPFDHLPNAENIREYLGVIDKCGETLLGIINDVLLLSSIEAGQFNINNEEFAPLQSIKSGIASFKFKAKRKGTEINFEHKDVPNLAIGDKLRFNQIIFNILGNSVKFTNQGKIDVKAEYKDGYIDLTIKDTGSGIPDEKLGKIMHPFYQADQSSTRQQGGTGLGLAIVSRILEKIGGSIKVSSEINIGTQVSISFPVSLVNESTNYSKTDASKNSEIDDTLNILIIEDDLVNIMYLNKIFQKTDNNYKMAESFAQMKKICDSWLIPDVVLIDIALPDADGFECLKWLKEKYQDNNVKYIVQSAHVMSDKTPRYKKAGFDDFIGKPYKKTELLKMIEKHVSR